MIPLAEEKIWWKKPPICVIISCYYFGVYGALLYYVCDGNGSREDTLQTIPGQKSSPVVRAMKLWVVPVSFGIKDTLPIWKM